MAVSLLSVTAAFAIGPHVRISWDGEQAYGWFAHAEKDASLEMATLQKSARRLSASALWRQRNKTS